MIQRAVASGGDLDDSSPPCRRIVYLALGYNNCFLLVIINAMPYLKSTIFYRNYTLVSSFYNYESDLWK